MDDCQLQELGEAFVSNGSAPNLSVFVGTGGAAGGTYETAVLVDAILICADQPSEQEKCPPLLAWSQCWCYCGYLAVDTCDGILHMIVWSIPPTQHLTHRLSLHPARYQPMRPPPPSPRDSTKTLSSTGHNGCSLLPGNQSEILPDLHVFRGREVP